MRKIASEYYKNRHGNCAQSVVVAWHNKTSNNINLVEELSSCGHGRAPENVCGALYAIHRLVDKDSLVRLDARFKDAAGGYSKCWEIRTAKTLQCTECVEVAADLLDKHLEAKEPEN
jgi:hypothetical protein